MLADGTDGMLAIPNARLGSMCPLMSVVPVAKWSCISGRWDTDVYCSKVLWARIWLRKFVGAWDVSLLFSFSPFTLFSRFFLGCQDQEFLPGKVYAMHGGFVVLTLASQNMLKLRLCDRSMSVAQRGLFGFIMEPWL